MTNLNPDQNTPLPVLPDNRQQKPAGRKRQKQVEPDHKTVSAAAATRPAHASKAEAVLKKLRSAKGATIQTLMEVTGWQAHSVRGFLAGIVKKKLGLALTSETDKDGVRRYRIVLEKGE